MSQQYYRHQLGDSQRGVQPNVLLAFIVLILLLIMTVLIYNQFFTKPTQQLAAPVATEQRHPYATQVADPHCASGQGWEWLVSVPDGQGGENWVRKGSCEQPGVSDHAQK